MEARYSLVYAEQSARLSGGQKRPPLFRAEEVIGWTQVGFVCVRFLCVRGARVCVRAHVWHVRCERCEVRVHLT